MLEESLDTRNTLTLRTSRLLSLGVNLLSREGYSQKEERKGNKIDMPLTAEHDLESKVFNLRSILGYRRLSVKSLNTIPKKY